jgi:probable HAF family extracellular repeat protein
LRSDTDCKKALVDGGFSQNPFWSIMKSPWVALGILLTVQSAVAQYTIREINACGGNAVDIGGLTDRGTLATSCFVESGDPSFPQALVPFIVDRSSVEELARIPGVLMMVPAGINKHRQVIANQIYPGDYSRAFLFQSGESKDLGTLGGVWAEAKGLSNFGDVVGSSGAPDGLSHAFLYRKGAMRDLGTFGAGRCAAAAINGRGQIVINRTFETNDQPVTVAAVYQGGALAEIESLASSYMVGAGINDRGNVVGIFLPADVVDWSNGVYPPYHAFFYHDGQMEDLHSQLGLPWISSYVQSINDHDEIVVSSFLFADAEATYGAFLYREGIIVDIASLLPENSGWSIKTAECINNAGEIAGKGYYQGNLRTYLLSPVKH